MINRPQIKAEARGLLHTAAVSPFLITAVVLLLSFVLERVSDLVEYGSLFYSYTYSAAYLEAALSNNFSAMASLAVEEAPLSVMSSFFTILISLFTVILNGGYYTYCIGIRQGRNMPYTTLLDGLSVSGRLIWCSILMSVKIILWSMLFFIPGLVAVYRYRFSYYNILTDSSLSASEAIRLSCRQTCNMKWKLFLLDLSFLGWKLLPAVLSAILGWMGLYLAAAAVTLAVQVWVIPYGTLCDLAYFEESQRQLGRAPYKDSQPPVDTPPWNF